jgi:hypothetical protein
MNKLALDRGARLVWASVGAALVGAGTRGRSLWDIGCSAVGSTMLLWAFAAPCVPKMPIRDMVDISSEDSFPASDPPSTW